MRHGFFITCLTANQARPIIDVALMADICGRSLLLDTVCNEDKSDYSKCVGCQASRGEAGKVWTMPSVHRKWPQIWHRIIKHRWGVWKGCSEIAPPHPALISQILMLDFLLGGKWGSAIEHSLNVHHDYNILENGRATLCLQANEVKRVNVKAVKFGLGLQL